MMEPPEPSVERERATRNAFSDSARVVTRSRVARLLRASRRAPIPDVQREDGAEKNEETGKESKEG